MAYTKRARATKSKATAATTAHSAAIHAPTAPSRRCPNGRFVAATPARTPSPEMTEENLSPTTRNCLDTLQDPQDRSLAKKCLDKIAELEDGLELRKSRSHRRWYRYVEEFSSDSEAGDIPRVSFMHQEDNKPVWAIGERFRGVRIKYFKQIFFGTFKTKDLIKLSRDHTNRMDIDNNGQQITDPVRLLRCFEVYCQAILQYAHPDVHRRLSEALSDYRTYLCELTEDFDFDSILAYHNSFMTARIRYGQDDPIAWVTEDTNAARIMLRKNFDRPATNSHPPGSRNRRRKFKAGPPNRS